MATALAERRADPIAVVRQNLTAMAPEFQAALPAHITVEKFTRVAMTAIQNNPDLAVKGPALAVCVRLAQDGLLPDGREAAIVMFGNKAQAMPMIAGILRKIRQSGEVSRVSAQVVYENDEFVWHLGFDEDVTHNPPALDKPRGKPIGAYATAVLKDGSRLLEVMSLEEIEKVRAVSRAKGNGPWVQWWGEMARKTVMRRLSKRLPMSTDIMDELDRDATLAPEPALIEHEPEPEHLSRLDALEHHISESSPQPAVEEPALEPSNTDGEAGAVQEGPDDSQRGDGDADREAREFVTSYIDSVKNAKNPDELAAAYKAGDSGAARIRSEFPDLYPELDPYRPADAPERG
jgi:recombination protein RecT